MLSRHRTVRLLGAGVAMVVLNLAVLAGTVWSLSGDVIDNFDNDQSLHDQVQVRDAGWWASNTTIYQLSVADQQDGNPTPCLHVVYTKIPGEEWSLMAAGQLSEPGNLSDFQSSAILSGHVYGMVRVLFKFQDVQGRESGDSGALTIGSEGTWQTFSWDFSQLNWGSCDSAQIQNVFIFVEPGVSNVSGEFYLDNLKLGDSLPLTVPPYQQRVICGRTEGYTDRFGNAWDADQAYQTGSWGYLDGTGVALIQYYIENTHDVPLYQYERLYPRYRFTVPGPGRYLVKILLAENWYGWSEHPGDVGTRVFNVRLNGQGVADNPVDILEDTGRRSRRALVKTYTALAQYDPERNEYRLDLETEPIVESPKFNAIEVSTTPTLTDTIDEYDSTGGENYLINCGGTKVRDDQNRLWMADEPLSLCDRWGYTNGVAAAAGLTLAAAVQETWRAGDNGLAYTVRLPNGDYRVRLIFADYVSTRSGERVFDVAVNGQTVASGLDVYLEAGPGAAVEKTQTVHVSNARLDITFPRVVAGQAFLNGLDVQVLNVSDDEVLDFIERRTLDFFRLTEGPYQTMNPANGLIVDVKDNFAPSGVGNCSIASVGFGLAAWCAARERGWLSEAQAYQTVHTALQFIAQAPAFQSLAQTGLTHQHGFYFHYLDMLTGARAADSELSSIDTTLLIAGVVTAAETFPGTDIATLASDILNRMQWDWFVNGDPRGYVNNAWNPETQTFSPYRWSGYNEDVLLYALGIGAAQNPVPAKGWLNLTRYWYGGSDPTPQPLHLIEWNGNPTGLFTHLYPYVFLDWRGRQDEKADYARCTAEAIEANRIFCQDYAGDFTSFQQGLWGVSASDSPRDGFSYNAYVPLRWGGDNRTDGTVNPAILGASLSLSENPASVLADLRRLFFQYKHAAWGRFGFTNALNLSAPRTTDNTSPSGLGWVSPRVNGIDLGALLLSIENYRTGFIWEKFMQHEWVQTALQRLKFNDLTLDTFDHDANPGDELLYRDGEWYPSEPSAYALTVISDVAGNTSPCLKIDYQKQAGQEWSYVSLANLTRTAKDAGEVEQSAGNLSYVLDQTTLSMHVLGEASLLLKFKDRYGNESSDSGVLPVSSPGAWTTLTWDYAGLHWGACDPRQINELLMFIQPGQTGDGTLYLDNLTLGPVADPPVSPWTPTPTPTPTVTATPTPVPAADLGSIHILFTSGRDIYGIRGDGSDLIKRTSLPPSYQSYEAYGANDPRGIGPLVMYGSQTYGFDPHPQPVYGVWLGLFGQPILSTTSSDDRYLDPRWSWGGTKLALHRGNRVLVCDPDGANLTDLSADGYDDYPCWTQDGDIVYAHRTDYSGPRSIYRMRADGSHKTLLHAGGDCIPSDCSPDGILFHSNASGEWQIYRLPLAGGEPVQLTWSGANRQARLTADFSWMVFSSTRDGNAEIYLQPLPAGDPVRVTYRQENDLNPYIYFALGSLTPTPTPTPATTPAPPRWEALGGSLNLDPGRKGFNPSLVAAGGTPYAAWEEDNGTANQIVVRHFDGSRWVQDGSSLNINPAQNGAGPELAASAAGEVYVIWEEAGRIRMKCLEGGAWISRGGALNTDPSQPARGPFMAVSDGSPLAAWIENNPAGVSQVQVKQWKHHRWVSLGGSLNLDPVRPADSVHVAVSAGTPYATWREPDASGVYQVRVSRWNGKSWRFLGDSLNLDPGSHGLCPCLGFVSGTPIVCFQQGDGGASQMIVKRWNGAAWVQDGGSLNVNPAQPAVHGTLAVVEGTPYATWHESDGMIWKVFVKHWENGAWVQDGGALNRDPTSAWAFHPYLASSERGPVVTWMEMWRVYGSRLTGGGAVASAGSAGGTGAKIAVEPVATWTPTPAPTAVMTATPTPTEIPIDFGGREVIAFPNPARGKVQFVWQERGAEAARIEIYSLAGERVAELKETAAGSRRITWDTAGLAPGIYLYQTILTVQGRENRLPVRKIAVLR